MLVSLFAAGASSDHALQCFNKMATYQAVENGGLPEEGVFIPPHTTIATPDLLSATKKTHFAERRVIILIQAQHCVACH